jgi:hypothetical protein
MSEYGEYTTVRDTREIYLSSQETVDDELILSFIRQVSRDIDRIARRRFYPTYVTKYYNTPPYNSYDLELNNELITLISVINGNGDSLDITKLVLYDLNAQTKRKIRLLPTVSTWKNSSLGFPDGAIAVTGVWGHMYDPTAGWQRLAATLAEIDTDVTEFDATAGVFFKGMLIKIDSEFMYVSDIDTAESTDTVTIERAVNGSIIADHDEEIDIYVWSAGNDIKMLTAAASVAYYNLKSNPMASSYTIDGITFMTPKDVAAFMRERLSALTLLRLGFA